MDDHTLLETIQMAIKLSKLEQHPVGSIYTSTIPTDPHELFGGTWEPIQDTFLWCAGPKHAAGTSGGEETHTLIIEEMPPFSVKVASAAYQTDYVSPGGRWSAYAVEVTNNTTFASQYIWAQSKGTQNQAHNNMPPFVSVYAWKRVK